MLFETTCYPRAVLVKSKVYIGGGVTKHDKRAIVMCYDLRLDVWAELPCYYSSDSQYMYPGLAAINDDLLLVGGIDTSTCRTDMVCKLNETATSWSEAYPRMNTACDSPTVVTYQDRWLVVIGGRHMLSRVEVLDTQTQRWYNGAPLPLACYDASAAIINGMCYIIGGSWYSENEMCAFQVNLDDLIQLASSKSITSSVWQKLPDAPTKRCTALAMNGALLTLGGRSPSASDINLYRDDIKGWVKVGQLPRERCDCACLFLGTRREILVCGGDDDTDRQVDIGK